jgi:TonB-dependent starch-binding outer membrane protein SusC
MRTATALLLRTVGVVLAATLVAGCAGQRPQPLVAPGEEIAIGYGRVRPADLNGSASSLSGEDLELLRVSRVEELIRDRVPGVQVRRLANGDYSFRIRGTRSIIGNNEPLVVIDGMPVSSQVMHVALAGLSPNEVVRIDVLKDAGLTAAYGSRGANGVIVITTRAYSRD